MRLKEYIAALQNILEEHGDLQLIAWSDGECNSYNLVSCEPGVVYTDFSDDFVYESLEEYLDADYVSYDDDDERQEMEKDFKENFEKVVIVN